MYNIHQVRKLKVKNERDIKIGPKNMRTQHNLKSLQKSSIHKTKNPEC